MCAGMGVGDWQAKAVAHGVKGPPPPPPRSSGGIAVIQDGLNSECQGGAESEGEKERWSSEHHAKGLGHYEGQWGAMEEDLTSSEVEWPSSLMGRNRVDGKKAQEEAGVVGPQDSMAAAT